MYGLYKGFGPAARLVRPGASKGGRLLQGAHADAGNGHLFPLPEEPPAPCLWELDMMLVHLSLWLCAIRGGLLFLSVTISRACGTRSELVSLTSRNRSGCFCKHSQDTGELQWRVGFPQDNGLRMD
jgi:hypothetical protein